MRKVSLWWALAVCVAVLAVPAGVSALPAGQGIVTVAIGYQGILSDASGQPLSGTFPMQFRLYKASTGGTSLWDSGPLDVSVAQGAFDVTLSVPQGLLDGSPLWLAISVDGETLGPRQQLLAAPYAAGLLPSVSVRGSAGDVFSATSTGVGSALRGLSPEGVGVYGSSDRGRAVVGENVGSAPGEGYGGYFTSSSGVGLYGENTAEAGAANLFAPGVQGYSVNGYGVLGESASAARAGVAGRSPYGVGVRGESPNGVGLDAIGTNGLGLRVRSVAGTGADVQSEQGTALIVASGGADAADHAGSFSARAGHALLATSTNSAAVRAEAGDTLAAPNVATRNGVIGRGQDMGVYGASEAGDGVVGASVGGIGVRGVSQSNYAGHFTSQGQRALYVANTDGRYLDAYFGGDLGIEVAGSARVAEDLIVYGDARISGNLQVAGGRSGTMFTLAINAGPTVLQRGDLVEIVGLAPELLDGGPAVRVRRTEGPSSRAVVGVVACTWDADGGFGASTTTEIPAGSAFGVATQGTFDGVLADASAGAILPGDLLVSSATGLAMRSESPSPGTMVGKALEALPGGTGPIAVFLTLQ